MNEQEYNVTRRLFSAIFVLVSITVIDFSFPSGLQLEGLLPHFLVRCRSGMCTRSTTGVQTSWLSSLRYGGVAFGIATNDMKQSMNQHPPTPSSKWTAVSKMEGMLELSCQIQHFRMSSKDNR